MRERIEAIQELLKKCAIKYNDENIQNIPFDCDDRYDENQKNYIMCYNKNNPELEKYCGPDFGFYHWPTANIHSFEKTRDEIIEASKTPPTIDKVGWYGNIYSPLMGVLEYYTRPLLNKIGEDNPELFDIVHISPHEGYIDNRISNYLSLPDLMRYKYLIDIGGNSWSCRLKWLLFSKRPLLLIDRVYLDYWHKDLIPYEHYIPVKMDLSDLLEQVEWMKNNYEKSLEIANNAYEFAIHHFTEDKILERIYYVYQNLSS
jgi:hypothetical protein